MVESNLKGRSRCYAQKFCEKVMLVTCLAQEGCVKNKNPLAMYIY